MAGAVNATPQNAQATQVPPPQDDDSAQEAAQEYTVKEGDTLGDIAQKQGLDEDEVIDAYQRDNPTAHPSGNVIMPGDTFRLPSASIRSTSVGGGGGATTVGARQTTSAVGTNDAGAASWMSTARQQEGVRETGGAGNPQISQYHAAAGLKGATESTPWCGSFVSWTLKESGHAGLPAGQGAAADQWQSGAGWGVRLNSPAEAKFGDVVVTHPKGRERDPSAAHVGFLVSQDANSFTLLGGNQSNQVSEQTFSKRGNTMLSAVRPSQLSALAADGTGVSTASAATVPRGPTPAPPPATPVSPTEQPVAREATPAEKAAADQKAQEILKVGQRDLWKDDYGARFAAYQQAMLDPTQTPQQRQALNDALLTRDSGAFSSWMTAARVRDSKSPQLIGDFIDLQNRRANNDDGVQRSVMALSGVQAQDMPGFFSAPENQPMLNTFKRNVQTHQGAFETVTGQFRRAPDVDVTGTVSPVKFTTGPGSQQAAMRQAFEADDGLTTSGELLLAYPDRVERNEKVTAQYRDLSERMRGLVGSDNASWVTYATWASDEVGATMTDPMVRAPGAVKFGPWQFAGDPAYWLSSGNSKLVSDIGVGFNEFTKTYSDPATKDKSFEQFWSDMSAKYQGRGISYLDGNAQYPNANKDDMKNAFRAYYEAMHIEQKIQGNARSAQPLSAAEIATLQDQKEKLMLYGNTLSALQEQAIADKEVDEVSTLLGNSENSWITRHFVNMHVPQSDHTGTRQLNTNKPVPTVASGVHDFFSGPPVTITGADGKPLNINESLQQRLEAFGRQSGNDRPLDIATSGAADWEQYEQRMPYIFHFFKEFQHSPEMFDNPREYNATRVG